MVINNMDAVVPYLLSAQSRLVKNLESGNTQTLIVYGTSVSSMRPNGPLWVKKVEEELNKKYDNRLTVLNTGKSGQNSIWALKNLEDSVLLKKPDAVIIEFATNDAVTRFNISLKRLSREYGTIDSADKRTFSGV